MYMKKNQYTWTYIISQLLIFSNCRQFCFWFLEYYLRPCQVTLYQHYYSVIQLGTGLRTMFPSISQIVLKNFVKNSLINEEILIKLAIVPKISKSSWNTVIWLLSSIKTIDIFGQLKVIFDTIINALPLILFDEIIQLLSSVITPSSNYPIKLL
jgi:hypothetical protein